MIIFPLFLLFGCASSVHIASQVDTIYCPHCFITVSSQSKDPLNIKRGIEQLLISKGYIVVSNEIAHTLVRMEERRRTLRGEEASPPQRTKQTHPIYLLRFSYKHYLAIPYGYYIFTNFSASFVNLMDGHVIASAHFSQSSFGSKSANSALEEFVDKLSHMIKRT